VTVNDRTATLKSAKISFEPNLSFILGFSGFASLTHAPQFSDFEPVISFSSFSPYAFPQFC
jgi:hypothetical protein